MYFEDSSNLDVTAEGLSQSLKSYRFIVSLNFLYDVLTTLYQSNKTLQIACYHPSNAQRKVNEVIRALENRYTGEDIRWGPFAVICTCMQQIECGQLIVDYGRVSILESKERAKRDAVKFIKAVIENLKARFPDNELVEASNIFDPKSLPTSDTDLRMAKENLNY